MSKKIAIACEVCRTKNYHVNKTKDERLEMKKFCPVCNLHTLHKEEK